MDKQILEIIADRKLDSRLRKISNNIYTLNDFLLDISRENQTKVVTFCCSTNNNILINKTFINQFENKYGNSIVILSPEFLNLDYKYFSDDYNYIENNLERIGISRINAADLVIFITKDDGTFGNSTLKEFKAYCQVKNIVIIDMDEKIMGRYSNINYIIENFLSSYENLYYDYDKIHN